MPKKILKTRKVEETLRRRADELTMLHAVSLDITASLDLPSLLKAVVERAVRLLNASGGCLYRCRPDQREVECVVSYQTPLDYTNKILTYGQGAAGIVAESGEPLIVNDYLNWPNQLWHHGEEHSSNAVLTVPMLWHASVSGVLQVLDESRTRNFSRDDQELLSLFADQAAIAIENARLLNAERAARAQAETLREAARVVSASLDPPVVLRLILEQLTRVLTFDTACVMLLGERGRPDMVAGIGYTQAEATSQSASELLKASPVLTKMSQDLQPVLIGDVVEESDWIWVPGASHVRSFMGVPIVARQKMIGVMMVDNAQPNFFSEADLNTARALAQQMGVAIENALLYAQAAAERRHLSLLYDIVRELASSLDADSILSRAIDLTYKALGGVVGQAFLLPAAKKAIKPPRTPGTSDRPVRGYKAQVEL